MQTGDNNNISSNNTLQENVNTLNNSTLDNNIPNNYSNNNINISTNINNNPISSSLSQSYSSYSSSELSNNNNLNNPPLLKDNSNLNSSLSQATSQLAALLQQGNNSNNLNINPSLSSTQSLYSLYSNYAQQTQQQLSSSSSLFNPPLSHNPSSSQSNSLQYINPYTNQLYPSVIPSIHSNSKLKSGERPGLPNLPEDTCQVCLIEGTNIVLNDGTTVKIENTPINSELLGYFRGELEEDIINNNKNNKLVSLSLLNNAKLRGPGLNNISVCNNIIDNGQAKCYRLTFIDGRELICTPNHKILLSNGLFIEARHLIIGQDKVKFSIAGTENPIFSSNIIVDWCVNTPIGVLRCNNYNNSKQLYSIAQLLGFSCNNNNSLQITAEHQLDAEIIVQWIIDACGIVPSLYNNQSSYIININNALRDTLKQLRGKNSNKIPEIITADNCPEIIKLGFLRGLFGNNANSSILITSNITNSHFQPINIIRSFDNNNESVVNSYFIELSSILSSYGIHSTIQSSESEIRLEVDNNSIKKFIKTIGFGANWNKTIKAEIANTIINMRKYTEIETINQLLQSINADSVFNNNNHNVIESNQLTIPVFDLLLVSREEINDSQHVYDLTVPLTSSFIADGIIVHNCFTEEDTRILTDHGWLFLDEIESLLANKQSIQYAAYDKTSKQLLYSPGELIINKPNPNEIIINFTHPNEERNWESNPYDHNTDQQGSDSNHLSIRVTSNHEMFVQLGNYDSG